MPIIDRQSLARVRPNLYVNRVQTLLLRLHIYPALVHLPDGLVLVLGVRLEVGLRQRRVVLQALLPRCYVGPRFASL